MPQLRNVLAKLAFIATVLVGLGVCPSDARAQRSSESLAIPDTDDRLPGVGPIRRYDWFRNLWNEKRKQWASRIQADQDSVVFLGDSITQGWGDSMGDSFPGL